MKLQYVTDCALLIMAYLTGENRVVSSRELEKMINFPQQSIFTAGRKLKSAGFVNTVSGPFGGYILAKSPEEITIQDILSAFKDAFCISDSACANRAATTTLNNFAKLLSSAEEEVKVRLSTFTLMDLLKDPDSLSS
ncbi:MAG: Rrf2 family transcriptional regulator [Oscillospiraceae bacterium]|nr:Rrf2 family transcriptional regulator [Oscillospiraceae bacterium]